VKLPAAAADTVSEMMLACPPPSQTNRMLRDPPVSAALLWKTPSTVSAKPCSNGRTLE